MGGTHASSRSPVTTGLPNAAIPGRVELQLADATPTIGLFSTRPPSDP